LRLCRRKSPPWTSASVRWSCNFFNSARKFEVDFDRPSRESAAVRQELKAESDETRAQMRTLHEELRDQIKLLGEGLND
jgi:hypothetical protein